MSAPGSEADVRTSHCDSYAHPQGLKSSVGWGVLCGTTSEADINVFLQT